MVGIDFDFGRYINHRRGLAEKRVRDGAAYAYVGERKIRRALVSARPVTLALEATSRMWRGKGKGQLLASSVKASDKDYPEVLEAARIAADRLQLALPPVLVDPGGRVRVPAAALGVDDDAVVVLDASLCARLDPAELVFAIAHQLSHIQNEHILFVTALHYLKHESLLPIRWAAQPAIVALSAWARRAALTCDRAGLVATGDLEVAMRALSKTEAPVGRYKELLQSQPDVEKRLQALRIFATTTFFLRLKGDTKATGISTEDADAKVGELLKVFT